MTILAKCVQVPTRADADVSLNNTHVQKKPTWPDREIIGFTPYIMILIESVICNNKVLRVSIKIHNSSFSISHKN